MKKKKYCLLVLLYGKEIINAVELDLMLKKADSETKLLYYCDYPPTEEQKDFWSKISYLRQGGFISEVNTKTFSITQKGKIFLAKGGFAGEVKTGKNAAYAFGVSLTAIAISIITIFIK